MITTYTQSSLHVEIQSLKDALSASQRKADRYAQLSATFYQVSWIALTRIQSSRFLSSWTTSEITYVIPAGRS